MAYRHQQRMVPALQRSTILVYYSPWTISGAMLRGLPLQLVSRSPLTYFLANPKSAILIVFPLMRILAGFKSLWTTPDAPSTCNPFTICAKQFMAWAQGKGPFLRSASRVPPGQNQMNRQTLVLLFITSTNFTTLWWEHFLMEFTSCLKQVC